MPTEVLSLASKIAEIRQNLGYTEKRGENKFHNYRYVMAEDIAADLGKQLAHHNVVITRRDLKVDYAEVKNAKGDIETAVRLQVTYVLKDGASGEELTYESAGEGRDKGDKGIYKAWTGAFKYFFIQAFAMPLGDDPEASAAADRERETGEAPSSMSSEELKEIVKLIAMSKTDVKNVLGHYGISELKYAPYEELKTQLGKKLRRGPAPADVTEAASYPAAPPELMRPVSNALKR